MNIIFDQFTLDVKIIFRMEMHHETQVIREQLMDILTDADLAFTPGGSNPTLGEIWREMADTEAIYIGSLKRFKMDWLINQRIKKVSIGKTEAQSTCSGRFSL